MPNIQKSVTLLLFFISVNLFSQEFVSIWNTNNTSSDSSANNEITIPTNPAYTTYNYTVDWGDGNSDTGITGNITHAYATPGTYSISISGTFPAIYFNNTGDKEKIIEILSWGDIEWLTMENAFYGCENLNFDAIDSPDLSRVTSLKNMFRECNSFNGIVNNWDISTITDISGMFYEAVIFNRPLNSWTTNAITDMSQVFREAKLFNEPLDNWITSNVVAMSELFYDAENFNQNIGNWDVSKVTDMSGMFFDTDFNYPLNLWRVDNVTNMSAMFKDARDFDQNIVDWLVDNVTDMSEMFYGGNFNNPLEAWNVANVENMSGMFGANRLFNQPLNGWDVSAVTNMSYMFGGGGNLKTVFNQPLNLWNVSNVTDMSRMFSTSAFNQPIDNWNVSAVKNMSGMFGGSPFHTSDFDQPLPNWEVDEVTNMSNMFQYSVFNQDIGMWNIEKVTIMNNMFAFSQNFNQILTGWNTGNVTQMREMFSGASVFDHNLGGWDITSVNNMTNMLSNSALSQENYDNTLIGWATQAVNANVSLGATGVRYCDGLTARQELIDTYNWNVTGDVVNCTNVFCTTITSPIAGDTNVPANSSISWEPTPNATGYRVSLSRENGGSTQVIYDNEDFGNIVQLNFTNEFTPGDNVEVTVIPYNAEGPAVGCSSLSFTVVPSWVNSPAAYKLEIDTRLPGFGATPSNQFEMEINSDFTYNYSIDWGDGKYDNNVSSDIIHTYLIPGIYTIAVIGDYPAPFFGTFGDGEKVLSIEQWGTYAFQSMHRACNDCENMVYNATDIPDLSQVTDMSEMFSGAVLFNGDINDWDVSNVTNMQALFNRAQSFNQPLDNWVVDNVTNMSRMFDGAQAFNQPLTTFETGNVTNMASMFRGAAVFNQDLNGWDVSNVTNMFGMLSYTGAFNRPLNQWEVNNVTDMGEMFKRAVAFNQPIDSWIVDNVTNMAGMFDGFYLDMAFNQPLNSWNVDKVTNMQAMFQQCIFFDQPLNNWKTGLVEDMSQMFQEAELFNQNIDLWNVTNVLNMTSMFQDATNFDSPLNSWDVNSVVNMSSMFKNAIAFDQPLDDWEVSAVANMTSMFENAELFNMPLNSWDVSSVTQMPSMFKEASAFNGTMANWNVASVTTMSSMFEDAAAFDQPISNWDTGAVLTMQEMFKGATAFNQNIDAWDVSFVTTMQEMFREASAYNQTMDNWNVASVNTMQGMFQNAIAFNEAIGSWNVRGVTTMENMFRDAVSFNQDLNNWRVSGVSNMNYIFSGASSYNQPMNLWNLGNVSMRSAFSNATALDQYLGDWDVSGVSNMTDMLDNTALIRENYDNTLIAWSDQTLTSGITLGAEGLPYCDAQEERQSMIDTFGWTFDQDVRDCPIPECTQLASPLNGDTDVPVNTNITWDAVLYAQRYYLTVGTTPGGNDIVDNETITNETFYEFAADFDTGDTVYVTLLPSNDEGDAVGPCSEESFTISSDPATIPDCTNLTEPLNSATDVLVTSDLSWNPISNADGYKLTLGTSTGASDILNMEDVGNLTIYDLATDLPEDTDIFVTIVPYNDRGDATGCTEESFRTELIPVPPVCTSLISPSNNATDVPIDTNLSWNSIANATGYLVSVGTTSGGIEVANSVDVANNTSYSFPADLQENRTYYVRITPYNDVGDATGCIEENFRTGNSTLNDPPFCTELTSPSHSASNVSITTDLTWNSAANADGYYLTVGTTSGGNDILDAFDVIGANSYDLPADLPENTQIFVTIVPYNGMGSATGCTEESFMTETVATIPNCTALSIPVNSATDFSVSTDLTWDTIANADGYYLTIGTNSGGNDILDAFDVIGTNSYNLPADLPEDTLIFVTIVPYNGMGSATGCTEESFMTETVATIPSCTALSIPANTATDVSISTNLTWNAIANADGYYLTVGTTSGGNDILDALDVIGANSYDLPTDLPEDTQIFVTVVPYNGVGSATGCTEESFMTETVATIPSCTALSIPANTATDVSISTNLTWNAIANADGYYLTVGTTSGGNDILDSLDVIGANSYDLPADLPEDTQIFVTVVPYNRVGSATGCTEESFMTETVATIPSCTALSIPANTATDVSISTNLTWNAIANADGYYLTVGTTSGGNDILDALYVTGANSYDLPTDLPENTQIFVTVVPYNGVRSATGCTEESFTTETLATVPDCISIISPSNNETDVSLTTTISWQESSNANGYKLTVGTTSGGNNIIDNEDVSILTTYSFNEDLEEGTTYYVTITPYNELGEAITCEEFVFTTVTQDDTLYGFSPNGDGINDYWSIDGIESVPENTVFIYNRWGDLVFQIQGYDNQSNVFAGIANKKTQLGASELPSGTYFFNIQVSGEHNLKKLQGFVVLKR